MASVLAVNPFVDSNNALTSFSSDFSSYLRTVNLGRLKNTSYLSNDQIKLDVDDAYPTTFARPTDNLVLNASDPKMAQANVYHQIDSTVQQLLGLSAFPQPYPQLRINTHCQAGTRSKNNAYYDTTNHSLCMGYSPLTSATVWSAFDSDVIVHEFAHSMNHKISTDEILLSTGDLFALDEGSADVSAYLRTGNPYIASYYGRAIYEATHPGVTVTNYKGLRDLTALPSYPSGLLGEAHVDSTMFSSLFYDLRQAGVEPGKLQKLLHRVISDLQQMDTFANVVQYMKTEATAVGIDPNLIVNAANRRGLHRKDSMDMVTVSAVHVVDNHQITAEENGNCNSTLDAGELALVLVNLRNSSTGHLGTIQSELTTTAPSTDIEIIPGGDKGTYIKIKPSSDYLTTLFPSRITQDYQKLAAMFSGYMIRAKTGASGTYTFNLKLKGFDSMDNTPSIVNRSFTLTIGNQAPVTGTKCANARDEQVWP